MRRASRTLVTKSRVAKGFRMKQAQPVRQVGAVDQPEEHPRGPKVGVGHVPQDGQVEQV
jgi:hypothetical protein